MVNYRKNDKKFFVPFGYYARITFIVESSLEKGTNERQDSKFTLGLAFDLNDVIDEIAIAYNNNDNGTL